MRCACPHSVSKIENLIEEGYDQLLLSLEDELYANCVINGIDHPKLQSWKTLIDNRETRLKERDEELTKDFDHFNSRPINPQSPIQSTKIGRNDSCPCGSGKKYKKCCGK